MDWFCWENLNRKPMGFLPMGFYHQIDRVFRCKFSHHPSPWIFHQEIIDEFDEIITDIFGFRSKRTFPKEPTWGCQGLATLIPLEMWWDFSRFSWRSKDWLVYGVLHFPAKQTHRIPEISWRCLWISKISGRQKIASLDINIWPVILELIFFWVPSGNLT